MPRRRLLAFPLLATVAGLPAAEVASAAPVDLLSHRAAYRLSLGRADTMAGLQSVRGALVVEWRADCAGWLSQQRVGFKAEAAEGPGFDYDVRFSSWEAPDYSRLRFNVRSLGEGKVNETFSGTAELAGPGGAGSVTYTEPEGDKAELPPGTLFPTEHVVRLIEAATKGERIVSSLVFDGSGPDALNRVTAVIGAETKAAGSGERRWPVSLAYHAAEGTEELPEFELAFALAENGVLHDLTLDYGDFALKGELEKMETLPEPSCG